MDISVQSVGTWTAEDRSWLGSRDGTEVTQSITLDTSAFTAATHYPAGYLKSGTVLAKLASGLYGPYAPPTAEVKTATITGAPTGGTFTLTFDGATTAAIAYNAAASAVLAALEAIETINAGDITVTGSAGGPYTITFVAGGRYAGVNVPAMTATATGLTGGTSPGVTMATTTEGSGSGAAANTAVGFLFSSVRMRDGGPDVGGALHWRGVIKESRLPTNHGLDATAKAQLAAKFLFR